MRKEVLITLKRRRFCIPYSRMYSKIVRERLRIPRTHSKAGTNTHGVKIPELQGARASFNRTNRWRWSPKRFLVDSRWLHASSSHWTSRSTQCAGGRDIPYPTDFFFDVTRSTLTLIWTSCKKSALMIAGMSMRTEVCQMTGFTKFTLLKEEPPIGYMWSGGTDKKFKRQRDQITCVQKCGPISAKQRKDEKDKNGANGKPKLENARKMRGIYFIGPEDEEHQEDQKCEEKVGSAAGSGQCRAEKKNPRRCRGSKDPTRQQMEPTLQKGHEDHIAGKGDNSMNHFYLVHEFILMQKRWKFGTQVQQWKKNGKSSRQSKLGSWISQEPEGGCSGSTKKQKQSPLCCIDGLVWPQECGVLEPKFQRVQK